MAAGVLPSSTAGTVSPVEREARWTLFARFATEAAGDTEARSVLRQALAGLDEELPLHGEPVVHPRWPRNPDEIWVAELAPDLTPSPSDHPRGCQDALPVCARSFPNRRGQLPQGPAGSRGGPASQGAAPVAGAGTPPPIGQAPPHAAEAAPRRRPTTATAWVTAAASTAS